MSITHRRLVRTEGQCPPNLSGPTSETTGTGSGVGGVGFVQGLRSRKRQLSFEGKGPLYRVPSAPGFNISMFLVKPKLIEN